MWNMQKQEGRVSNIIITKTKKQRTRNGKQKVNKLVKKKMLQWTVKETIKCTTQNMTDQYDF